VSTFLDVDTGPAIVAERPMYFAADPGVGQPVTGGHDVVGVAAPSATQLFAEGYTGPGFVEYLTLANADPSSASTVEATYAFEQRAPVVKRYTVGPSSRFTVRVNDEVGAGEAVSVQLVTKAGPGIVAERPMYFRSDPGLGQVVDGGHDVTGCRRLATAWDFAEGYTGPGFVEYLTVANFAPDDAVVSLLYAYGDSPPLTKNYTVGGNRRLTVPVNAEAGAGHEVSVRLVGLSGPSVVAERPLYFRGDPGLGQVVDGGHDVMGYAR
jgi:hypothetical protein